MKRGAYDLGRKPMYLILVIFIMTVAFLVLYTAASRFYGETVAHVDDVRKELLGNYLLTSPHCFTYLDASLQRYYPGQLDVSKLKEEQLAKCVRFFPSSFSVRLKYGDKVISLGSSEGTSAFYPAIVVDAGKRYPGTLEVVI